MFPRETAFVGADVELVGIRLYPGWDDIAAYARNHGEKPVRLAGDTVALLHFIHEHRRALDPAGGPRLAEKIFLGNTVTQARGGAGRGAARRVAWPGCAEAGAAQPGSAPSRPCPLHTGVRCWRKPSTATRTTYHQLRRPLDGRENPGGRLRTHQPPRGLCRAWPARAGTGRKPRGPLGGAARGRGSGGRHAHHPGPRRTSGRPWIQFRLTAPDGNSTRGGEGSAGANKDLDDASIMLQKVAGGWHPRPLRALS